MTMKSKLNTLAMAVLVAVSGAAQAGQIFNVEVWIGSDANGVSRDASHANIPGVLSGTYVHSTFKWTGPINWVSSVGGQNNDGRTLNPGGGDGNLFSNFVSGGTISNYAGNYTQAQLLNTSLSTAGYNWNAFFKITGFYTSAGSYNGSITHDDGASLYVDNNFGSSVFTSANPTYTHR